MSRLTSRALHLRVPQWFGAGDLNPAARLGALAGAQLSSAVLQRLLPGCLGCVAGDECLRTQVGSIQVDHDVPVGTGSVKFQGPLTQARSQMPWLRCFQGDGIHLAIFGVCTA